MWNVLDPESKRLAASDGVSGMTYEKRCLWIDMRYKCMSGSLEYKATGKDDPMGLALFAESDALSSQYPSFPPPLVDTPAEPPAELDAFGNGKGKGKGKGDGRCHVCNGEGHFARDCPSTLPVSSQSVECLGCNGRGHYRRECPTANPHLKGGGKEKDGGKGWGPGKGFGGKGGKGYKGGKGKGFGGKGKGGKGKGYGGKGPGVYGLDLMGTDSWGCDGSWGGEQAWANQEYGNEQWGENEGTYLRSLATLESVPVITKNSFDALADRHDRPVDVRSRHDRPIDVPLADLIVTSQRKIRNKTKNKQTFIDKNISSSCCSSSLCRSTCPSSTVGPGRCPPTPLKI
jgi:hypothetical protein